MHLWESPSSKTADEPLQELLVRVFDAASIGMYIVDESMTLLRINSMLCGMLGRRQEELTGTSLLDILHPDHHEEVKGITRAAVLGLATSFQTERLFRKGNGDWIRTHVRSSVLRRDGDERFYGLSTVEDVTAKLFAEEALRESEARYRNVVEDQTEFIVRWLPDGTRTFVNESYCRFFQTPREELVGTSFLPLIPQDMHEAIWQKIASLSPEHPTATEEHPVLLPDGSQGWQQWTDRGIFNDRGELVELQSVGRDVTERRRLEVEAERHRQELDRAEKMISLGTLVSGVAHEINNPNHYILLNLQFLKDVWSDAEPVLASYAAENDGLRLANLPLPEVREEMQVLLKELVEGTERIRHIVSELREYSRDGETRSMFPVSINDAVRSALTLVANTTKKATHRFSVALGEVPLVQGNVRRLEQVVINLILNACQALESPEQAIRVASRHDASAEAVVLLVEDEGRGIAEADRGRIFDPFYTTRREEGGSGLGLAVATRIVEEHRGKLRIESEVSKGTKVELVLPVFRPPGEDEEEA